jgi:Fe-S oxidoreductase/nitrate reductase gamma subunit
MSEEATREIFWNVPFAGEIVFYFLAAISIAVFAYGLYRVVRRCLAGHDGEQGSFRPILRRLGRSVWTSVTDWTIFRSDPLAGIMHLLIFWGMVILFLGTVTIVVDYDILRPINPKLQFWHGPVYLWYSLVLDALGALLILGLALALFRRYLLRPEKLKTKRWDWLFPTWLLVIAVTGFFVEGSRIVYQEEPWRLWSPVGLGFGYFLQDLGLRGEGLKLFHAALWWLHAPLVLGWIAWIPFYPKVMHIFSAAINIYFERQEPSGVLKRLDVEGAFERGETLGVVRLEDLSWRDLLDLYSCTECGRCTANCPAKMSGKGLSPMAIVDDLRDRSLGYGPEVEEPGEDGQEPVGADLVGQVIAPERLWECTTCGACVAACPVAISPLSKILELRRGEVLMKDRYPEGFVELFKGLERRANPWGLPATARADWAKGLEVKLLADHPNAEYLFFVGCAGAFEPRNQKIAQSLVKVLQHAGVSFAILGEEETCTGDPARRIGHEYIFQLLAQQLVETLNSYKVKRIITICPHCYNTLKHEFPQFGGNYEVFHHTQFIARLLREGRLKLKRELSLRAAYHDSCYLGRHNDIYNEPRTILKGLPGVRLVELKARLDRATCCGGGGGLLWLEEPQGKRVNELRISQVMRVNPDVLVSACPFCMTMFEDGIAAKGASFVARDLAELVAEALG